MKVIVPIDNRPSSQATIDALLGIKWRPGTEIHLITVLPPGTQRTKFDGTPSEQIEAIEGIAADLRDTLPECQVLLFVREGDPKTAIVEMAQEISADLILMGSNCKTGLERLLLGSVSQAVLNSAHCPVIITRPDCEAMGDQQNGFKTVLVPIDDSVYSEVSLNWLANFWWSADTKFIVATIIEDRAAFDAAKEGLNQRAAQLAGVLGTNNIIIEVGTGEAHESIVQLARSYRADLIVMGSHGRTGLKKVLLGSVSQSVSQNAPCSIAIVRGFVAQDESWRRTGVYSKPKAMPMEEEPRRRSPDDRGEEIGTPQVLPAGLG